MGKKSRQKRLMRELRASGEAGAGALAGPERPIPQTRTTMAAPEVDPYPKILLEQMQSECGDELATVDRIRATKGAANSFFTKLPWADTVYVPTLAIGMAVNPIATTMPISLVLDQTGGMSREFTRVFRHYSKKADDLCCMAGWRLGKGVYRFDADFAAEIRTMPLDGEIPTDILRRLPEWAVYIDVGFRVQIDDGDGKHAGVSMGAFVYYDNAELVVGDRSEYYESLVILPRVDVRGLGDLEARQAKMSLERRLVVPLVDGKSVAECAEMGFNDVYGASNQGWGKQDVSGLSSRGKVVHAGTGLMRLFLNAALYLCSEEPDVIPSWSGASASLRPAKSNGLPSGPIRAWNVGVRMGHHLRSVRAEGREDETSDGVSHERMRPHMRRAHWHTYWLGPRTAAQREARLRWLHPMMINVADRTSTPVVLRDVGGLTSGARQEAR